MKPIFNDYQKKLSDIILENYKGKEKIWREKFGLGLVWCGVG